MDNFLPHRDELGLSINTHAAALHQRLQQVDPDRVGMPEHCLYYYKASHAKRLFFSIETSAHLLYRAIRLTRKRPEQIVLMDYGAGVGTLYLLAKMIGCTVVYNDHLDDWRLSAQLIAEAIGVQVDHYVVGDIGDSLDALDRLGLQCSLITSRNVVEHIYKLGVFYQLLHERQPQAVVFSSTTANSQNPASVVKHMLWHRRWEKVYRGKRFAAIERKAPELTRAAKERLARATQGLAVEDLQQAIMAFGQSGILPNPRTQRSNTCDPDTGVWAEHLLRLGEYRRLIGERRYKVSFAPGFWDTHYGSAYKNNAAGWLNRVIGRNKVLAMKLAPFMYVIAEPRVR